MTAAVGRQGAPSPARRPTWSGHARPAVVRTLRALVPVLVVVAVSVAIYPAASPASRSTELVSYLPADSRVDSVRQSPSGEIWQASQARVPPAQAWDALAPDTRDALGYRDDADAPELAGSWLVVDILPRAAVGDLRTTGFHVGPDAITLQSAENARSWSAFSPGLPVLTTGMLRGETVEWSGRFLTAQRGGEPARHRATAEVTARRVPDSHGCVETSARLAFPDGSVQDRTHRWCSGAGAGWAGEGIQVGSRGPSLVRTDEQTSSSKDQPAGAVPLPPDLTGRVADATFYREVNSTFYVDSQVGLAALEARENIVLIARDDGWVSRWDPLRTDQDEDSARWLGWRAMPGGHVTALASAGRMTVVGTTADAVSGYTSDGIRRWRQATSDVVTWIETTDETAVVIDASGTVQLLDARTGERRWSRAFSSRAVAAVAGGHVAVHDGDGFTVLAAATGEPLWSRGSGDETSDVGVEMVADLVVTKADGWLVARSRDDGAVRWWRRVDPMATIRATDEQVLILGTSSAEMVGPDGELRWRAAPTLVAHLSGERAVLAYRDHLELWDRAGRVASWEYPAELEQPSASPRAIALTHRGVLAYQTGLAGSRWVEYR
ncbi:PQQ-binding-like beta-propeller repeat protein [Georgenia alba]|uniref:PQQ-binding-like beta-propeller repeat protein n=1 Tax=Georgenia alba TaxID=2233858 RepID=A0ABW2QBG2_9MICO